MAQNLLVVVRAVLAAAIRMMDATPCWSSQRNGHIQRPDRQITFDAVAYGPPNDPPGMQVEDDRQVEPALLGPDMADVASPFTVWPIRREVPVQKIGAMLKLWLLSVVALNFLFRLTFMPFSLIRRPTRRWPTSSPSSFSSSVMRGRP